MFVSAIDGCIPGSIGADCCDFIEPMGDEG